MRTLRLPWRLLAAVLCLCAAAIVPARIVDDFNDNAKTGWTDFTFVPGFGLPTEAGGQFQFALPPARQDIFTASQKTSELFELKEGRTIEFQVDLIESSGADSFAVLAFIPNTGGNNPGTLQGYGLAKDPDDVLITKGIEKYFIADDGPTAELKNDNVTLVLTLTAKGGNVIVTGKILDKDANNAVLWERTVVDTPAADVMTDGTDSPATPYITTGYFTLYCYQQFSEDKIYSVHYDNAEAYVLDEAVLDDFNDNTKTGWTDFTFVPGFGLPTEAGGQFRFDLPPARQDIFTASQKVSEQIELKEGERHEFRVDLIESSGADSFAVLAFIPNTGGNNPGTLQGYGLAKDPDDVLITKGIEKYFIADDGPTAELKNDNVTLVLSLTVKGGNVIVNGKILDKDANNAVLWERTVVDTPAADVMTDGTDSPAAPYITTGYFTLYCYQQFSEDKIYSVYYDNAVVARPPAAGNTAPTITEVQPAEFAAFLPTTTQISFKLTDDKEIADGKVSVLLNGQTFTTANGLAITGSGGNKTATLGGLLADTNYKAVLQVEDADGVSASRTLYFDTFSTAHFVVEAEDYNFDAGSYFPNPVRTAEGGGPAENSYVDRVGAPDVDFSDTRTSANGADTMFRTSDPVRMGHTRDQQRAAFNPASEVWDYDVGDIASGEWLQYTRTFAAGSYNVYLREALANIATAESVLELVTGDRTQPGAAVQILGSFLGERTGFQYRHFPLTDASGQNPVVLRLNGLTTLRLRQITTDPGDGARLLNYLLFVPVVEAGKQRATVSAVAPANGAEVESAAPVVTAEIQNRDTSVKVPTVALSINGAAAAATVSATAQGAQLSFPLAPLPASGSTVNAVLTFRDSDDVEVRTEWSFLLAYKSLNPAHRGSGTGKTPGFNVRFVQAPAGSALENSLLRAEDQLAPNSTIPKQIEATGAITVVNLGKSEGDQGYFGVDQVVPGLDFDNNGDQDFSVEISAWLQLAEGVYRFGVRTDDGYKVSAGSSLTDRAAAPLDFHSGGPADETFEFLVPQAGLYPFRMVWYERGGSAHAELFVVDRASGERTLINAPDTTGAILAFSELNAPSIQVESAASVAGPYAADPAATINGGTITIPLGSGSRFFRLAGVGGAQFRTVTVSGQNLVLTFDVVQ